MRRWFALAAVYLALAVVGLAIVNGDQNNALVLYGLVAVGSIVLGWGTGSRLAALVAAALVPLAIPFGDTNAFTGGDDRAAVSTLAAFATVESVVLILLAAGARRVREKRHQPTGPL